MLQSRFSRGSHQLVGGQEEKLHDDSRVSLAAHHVRKILEYNGAVNPKDIHVSFVKGAKTSRLMRFQPYQTWSWEIRSHGSEFMLSPHLMEQAHIWVSPHWL